MITLPATEILLRSDFYVTGGTLRPDAPSYVERQADKELCEGLLRGEFCYVLTSRQMGKSSLMVRTVRRLREDGVAVAVLDLTAIGQNLSLEQWYDGLVSRLGQQLNLEDELLAFWTEHSDWGPLQRLTSALENVVLKKLPNEVVIFIDEIDIVRSLPFSTDEFFAGIRECYNRRAYEPAFNRLAFSLLGVAAPTDLIRDTRMTPFNIGRRIELNDFTPQEAAPLARGLGADEATANQLLGRVLYWTGGHPYLTQRFCRALSESVASANKTHSAASPGVPPVLPTPRDVDRLAEKLFLSRQARDRDDNLIFVRERLLRSEVDVPGLLLLYRRIHLGELVSDDETNSLISILHLSGIARGINGYLQVRNRIYRNVFDLAWIHASMPAAEVRRQRRAGRRGMVLGFTVAAVLLVSYLVFGPMWRRYREERLARDTAVHVQNTYANLKSYRDNFESTVEVGLIGSTVPITGSGSLVFDSPDEVSLAVKSRFNSPEIEVRLLRDRTKSFLYAPVLQQFQFLGSQRERAIFNFPHPAAHRLGPICALPLYRLLVDPPAARNLLSHMQDLQPGGYEDIDGQPTRMIRWRHEAGPFLSRLGITNYPSGEARIPVTAWVNTTNYFVLQLRVDLSDWARQFLGEPAGLPVTSLVITELHRAIRIQNTRDPAHRALEMAGAVQPVDSLELPAPNLGIFGASAKDAIPVIPPRLPYTPANLIDLTPYYNAGLTETWHPGVPNNTLEMLPRGLLQLAGATFDVRGIVQVSGRRLQQVTTRFPQQVKGIAIAQSARQLHFLHGTGWSSRDGTRLGSYVIHYVDGKQETIPIVYGEDVRDWNTGGDASSKLSRATIVWRAKNDADLSVRLFRTSWINPTPDVEISTMDFVSANADPAPFLLAITAEE